MYGERACAQAIARLHERWSRNTSCRAQCANSLRGQAPSGGCRSPSCDDGIDDDGDGRIDFDGGASWNGGTPIAGHDPFCASAPSNHESDSCGLGAELTGVLWLLQRTRSWKARASQRTSS